MESRYRTRKQWSTSIDIEIAKRFQQFAHDSRIPASRLLDEAIEDLLVKYKVMSPEEKKTP